MLPRIACTLSLSSLFFFTSNVAASDVVDLAASLIGRPYVWGAEGPTSFDCSGLMQYVFGEFDVDLPRRAVSQSKVGEPAGRRLRRGDLVFFASDTRRSLVTHVGIYEGAGVMVNASQRHGRVRRDDLDEEFWAERFMFARRVMPGNRDAEADDVPQRDHPEAERRGDRRRGAVRVLGRLAEALLRRDAR
jgi:hypothetical protein